MILLLLVDLCYGITFLDNNGNGAKLEINLSPRILNFIQKDILSKCDAIPYNNITTKCDGYQIGGAYCGLLGNYINWKIDQVSLKGDCKATTFQCITNIIHDNECNYYIFDDKISAILFVVVLTLVIGILSIIMIICCRKCKNKNKMQYI